jgi:hypothetical protein
VSEAAAFNYADAQAAVGLALQALVEQVERIAQTASAAALDIGRVGLSAEALKNDVEAEQSRLDTARQRTETALGTLLEPTIIYPAHPQMGRADSDGVNAHSRIEQAGENLAAINMFVSTRTAELTEARGVLGQHGTALAEFTHKLAGLRRESGEIEGNARPAF